MNRRQPFCSLQSLPFLQLQLRSSVLFCNYRSQYGIQGDTLAVSGSFLSFQTKHSIPTSTPCAVLQALLGEGTELGKGDCHIHMWGVLALGPALGDLAACCSSMGTSRDLSIETGRKERLKSNTLDSDQRESTLVLCKDGCIWNKSRHWSTELWNGN